MVSAIDIMCLYNESKSSRQEIMDVVKRMYFLQHKTNIPIYYV